MKIHGVGIFYGLTIAVLIGTGALILGWYLTPPNPDRVGYWYIVLFISLPFLASLGFLALALRRTLALPWWLGASLIAYPAVSYGLMALSAVQPLAVIIERLFFFRLGGEGFLALLWALTLVCVLSSLPALRGTRLPNVFAGVFLLACGVGLAYTYFQSYGLASQIDAIVLRAMAQGQTADFAQIDLSAWDTMYVFRPYTPHNTVVAALGFRWDGVDDVDIQRREDINVVVFVKGRSVVAYGALPRSKLDFESIPDYQAFTPQSARFHVRQAAGSSAVLLTPSVP